MNNFINAFPNKEVVKRRKEIFSPGKRVKAVYFAGGSINDNLTVPRGTKGRVIHVDDTGTVHVDWDNGVKLGVLIEDEIRTLA